VAAQTLAIRRARRRILQRLANILPFQIGIIGQDLLNGVACAHLADDGRDGDSQASDARFATHDGGVAGNAVQGIHGVPLASFEAVILLDFAR
jgi:hypothetical protein